MVHYLNLVIQPFGFFEFAWIGIPLTVATIVFMMLVGKHLLPKHEIADAGEVEQEVAAEDISNDPKKQLYLWYYSFRRNHCYDFRGSFLKTYFGINFYH